MSEDDTDDNPRKLQGLFANNRRWAERIRTSDPDFLPSWPPSRVRSICG